MGQEITPAVDGYVTRTVSASDFDVNGIRVICGQKSKGREDCSGLPGAAGEAPPIGERLQIYGEVRGRTVRADTIGAPSPSDKVSGFAIVDKVLSRSGSGEILVRADGYPVLIYEKTLTNFNPPLKTLSDISTNVWIAFSGRQRGDGVMVATKAAFTANAFTATEEKMDARVNYDPSAVSQDAKQSKWHEAVTGRPDIKKIPPGSDAAVQARVEAIGKKLIPEYQRVLPDSDRDKIHFRFQVVRDNHFHLLDALAMPNGIILVPRPVIDRLQNDSQLATVLADNIAGVLEKQDVREVPTRTALAAMEWAGLGGGAFVPGLGLATSVAHYGISSSIYHRQLEQSGRVSLSLLHDAGYDLNEAPMTWWLLAPKHPGKNLEMPIPERAAYLYGILGTTWRDQEGVPATGNPAAGNVASK